MIKQQQQQQQQQVNDTKNNLFYHKIDWSYKDSTLKQMRVMKNKGINFNKNNQHNSWFSKWVFLKSQHYLDGYLRNLITVFVVLW